MVSYIYYGLFTVVMKGGSLKEVDFLYQFWRYWFLQVLFLVVIIFYFISQKIHITSAKCQIIVGGICVILGLLFEYIIKWPDESPFYINVVPMAFFFYLLGFACRGFFTAQLKQICDSNGKKVMMLIIALCSLIVCALCNSSVTMYNNNYGLFPIFILGSLSGIVVVWVIADFMQKNMFLKWCGKNSIVIYVWQFVLTQFFKNVIEIIFNVTHVNSPDFIMTVFLFVHNESDYVFYAATTVIANAGANVFNFFHAKKYVKIHLTRNLNLKKHLKPIMIIFASTVTTTIYVNSDKTILGFLSDEFHVGLYSTSVNVYTVLKSCIAAVILVALPRLSNYLATNQRKEYEKTATDIFKMFMMILLPVMVGIFVTSDAVIEIIAGSSYAEAATSLKILSISLAFSMVATYYTNAVLLPMKQETIILKGTIMSAVLNIALNFALIGTFKQNGAAFTTLLAELLMCVYQYFYVRKALRIKVSLRYVISLISGCVGIIVVSSVCDVFLTSFILNLIIKILLSIVVYFMALLVLKNDTALSMVDGFLKKRRK